MKRVLGWIAVLIMLLAAAVITTYRTTPDHTAAAAQVSKFDTLIVLGAPCLDDGTPSPEQRERVLEAAREFHAGRAAHMIVTGGAAHNHWVEAESMAHLAEGAGVPIEALVVEGRARNTIENVFYSDRIMQQHGWVSAEVVSSPSHLPRAGVILGHYSFQWKTHGCPWPAHYSRIRMTVYYTYEALRTTQFRWFGLPRGAMLPGAAAGTVKVL